MVTASTDCSTLCTILSKFVDSVNGLSSSSLTLPVWIPDEEKKLSWIFIFTLLCGASKGSIKAFIKPFEAPQRSMKFKLIFILI